MRRVLVGVLVVAGLLPLGLSLGCGSTPRAPAPAALPEPAASPEPDAAPDPAEDPARDPGHDPVPQPETPAVPIMDDALLAALELMAEPEEAITAALALYVADTDSTYATETWSEEGAGAGMALVVTTAGVKAEPIEVFTPDIDYDRRPGARAAAADALAARLRGHEVVRMTAREWPVVGPREKPAAKMTLDDLQVTLEWKAGKLRLRDASGKVTETLDLAKQAEIPHVPEPVRIYAAPGVPVLVVEALFDPGKGFADGFNLYTGSYTLRLPRP